MFIRKEYVMQEKKWTMNIDFNDPIDFPVPDDVQELMNRLEHLFLNIELPSRQFTLYGAGKDTDSYFFYECEFRLRRDELGERIFEHIQRGDMTEEQRDILRLRYYPDFA